MSKHVLDRPKSMSNALLRRAVAIERGARPRKASLALQRRRRHLASRQRTINYLRMARRVD